MKKRKKKNKINYTKIIIVIAIVVGAIFISGAREINKNNIESAISEEINRPSEETIELKKQLEKSEEKHKAEQEYYAKYLHAKTLVSGDDIALISKLIYGECNHDNSNEEKAAIGWCALNRLDTGWWGDTLEDVICNGAFSGYDENNNVEEYYNLAKIILTYYNMEKMYGIDTNRCLPSDYLFFYGGGLHNYFTKEYHNGDLEFAVNNAYVFE